MEGVENREGREKKEGRENKEGWEAMERNKRLILSLKIVSTLYLGSYTVKKISVLDACICVLQ
jgi:hypothetical protein